MDFSQSASSKSDDNVHDHSVHLIYSEYDLPLSETSVEVIEGPQHYWWTSANAPIDEIARYYNHAPHGTNNYCTPPEGREVCLEYSDYDDEPTSERKLGMDKDNLSHNSNTQGRKVRLIYSDYEEPPSETDVDYDGNAWCSIFGNPALWKVRDEGREVHLIYSDYTASESEMGVEINDDVQPKSVETSDLATAKEKLLQDKECNMTTVSDQSEYDLTTSRSLEAKSVKIDDLKTCKSISNESIHDICTKMSKWIRTTDEKQSLRSVGKLDSDQWHLSSDIYTTRPERFPAPHIVDSIELVGEEPKEEIDMNEASINSLQSVLSPDLGNVQVASGLDSSENVPMGAQSVENECQLFISRNNHASNEVTIEEIKNNALSTGHETSMTEEPVTVGESSSVLANSNF